MQWLPRGPVIARLSREDAPSQEWVRHRAATRPPSRGDTCRAVEPTWTTMSIADAAITGAAVQVTALQMPTSRMPRGAARGAYRRQLDGVARRRLIRWAPASTRDPKRLAGHAE
ncbi:MAG: hypothetical protein ABI877_10730 [Gemmatimonadaceae bacterium]